MRLRASPSDRELLREPGHHVGYVSVLADSIVVTYRDADIDLDEVGTITAVAHIDGRDTQIGIPVSLLR